MFENFENAPGIYQFKNLINGKRYIGQSVKIRKRLRDHIIEATTDKNKGYNLPLARAIRKYGLENFEISVIEYCNIEQLNQKEIYYISQAQSNQDKYGYNLTIGGDLKPLQDKEINERVQKKAKATLKDKYGTEFLQQVPAFKEKAYETHLKNGSYKCYRNIETGLVFNNREVITWTGVKTFRSRYRALIAGKAKHIGFIPNDSRIIDKSIIGQPAHWIEIPYEEYIKDRV